MTFKIIKEKICPRCDSENVELVSSNDEGEMWLCQSCYHTFAETKMDKIVPRIIKREILVKKKAKKKSKSSKTKGRKKK